jgi:hypothetical protein
VSKNHFFILILAGITLAAIFPNLAGAKTKRHLHTVATVTTLFGCDKLPTHCSDLSDHTNACKTSIKGKTFEEDAYDSDNADCMKMRLWKKVCAQGLNSDGLKVNCR